MISIVLACSLSDSINLQKLPLWIVYLIWIEMACYSTKYDKYLLYRSLFTQTHGSTHCTYLDNSSHYRTLRSLSSFFIRRSRKLYDTHLLFESFSIESSVTEVTYFCLRCLLRSIQWQPTCRLCFRFTMLEQGWHTPRFQTQWSPPFRWVSCHQWLIEVHFKTTLLEVSRAQNFPATIARPLPT